MKKAKENDEYGRWRVPFKRESMLTEDEMQTDKANVTNFTTLKLVDDMDSGTFNSILPTVPW